MESLISELISIEQNFSIYRDALTASSDTASYEEITQVADQEFQRRNRALDTEKVNRLNGVFGRKLEEDEVSFAGRESTAGLMCALTAKLPDHPVVSAICHHVFECDAIKQYIRSHLVGREKRVHCPVAGCAAEFGMSDLRA
jgi:SUMO ligase MMS21 Smc5/6 complex component